MRTPIERKDLTYFYSTHPNLDYFKTIWGVEDLYLEGFYGEFKAIAESKYIGANGLYAYENIFWSANDMVSEFTLSEDDTYYYILLPGDILPISKSFSFEYKGTRRAISKSNMVSFVDYGDWFALRMEKSHIAIHIDTTTSEASVTFDGNTYPGIWLFEYAKDKNFIEDHFGEIIGIKINRSLYKTIAEDYNNPSDPYYDPRVRVLEVHNRYGQVMKDIVLTMMAFYSETYSTRDNVTDAMVSSGVNYIETNRPISGNVPAKGSITIVNKGIYDSGSGTYVGAGNTEEYEYKNKTDKIFNLNESLRAPYGKGSGLIIRNMDGDIFMLRGHPSPSNIRFVARSVLKNYAFRDESTLMVTDRVNTDKEWVSLHTHNLFVVSGDVAGQTGFSDDVFPALSRALAYFKPVFARGLIVPGEPSILSDEFNISDFEKSDFINLNYKEYVTTTVITQTIRDKKKLNKLLEPASIQDSIKKIKFVNRYIPGGLNENEE